MSSKFSLMLCDTNERAGNYLNHFLDNCKKFDSLDLLGGSRLNNSYLKHYVRTPDEINVLKSRFLGNYNMYMISSYVENSSDIPKNNAFDQNMCYRNDITTVFNGIIRNKEFISRAYEFNPGTTTSEFLMNYYLALKKHNVKDIIPNMVREIDSDLITFAIFDKDLNEVYLYNKGGDLFICTSPGVNVIVSTEILPINNIYPYYNFHKLNANSALKIDIKTMFVQNIPVLCNSFSFGKDLQIDPNKALLYTENCDLEYYTAVSVLNTKDVANNIDIQTLYFGFNTDIDKIVFEKILKLKRSLKYPGKLPVHIQYNFENLYMSESEAVDALNKNIAESEEENKKPNKKVNKIDAQNTSLFLSRKLNFIASNIINWALEKGIGTIYIPNTNRHNDRLIAILRALVKTQVHTPMYVISIFDEFSTMDIIHYVFDCKKTEDVTKILVNCDRKDLSMEINDSGDTVLRYNIDSDYCYEMNCAFMKCGMDDPFDKFYINKARIDNNLVNANIVPDKLFGNEHRAALLSNFNNLTRDAIVYQKKILSY